MQKCFFFVRTWGKNGVLIDMIDEVLARKEENGFKATVLVECLYMHKGIRIAYFHGDKFLMGSFSNEDILNEDYLRTF